DLAAVMILGPLGDGGHGDGKVSADAEADEADADGHRQEVKSNERRDGSDHDDGKRHDEHLAASELVAQAAPQERADSNAHGEDGGEHADLVAGQSGARLVHGLEEYERDPDAGGGGRIDEGGHAADEADPPGVGAPR